MGWMNRLESKGSSGLDEFLETEDALARLAKGEDVPTRFVDGAGTRYLVPTTRVGEFARLAQEAGHA